MPKLCFERQKSFSSFVLPIRFIDRSECIAIRQNHRTRQTNAFMWLQMDSEYICRLRTHPPEFFWFALHCNEWGHKSSHASEGPAHTHTKWQMRRFDLDIRAIILTTTKKHWKKKTHNIGETEMNNFSAWHLLFLLSANSVRTVYTLFLNSIRKMEIETN